jgi:hypothetical protein
MSDTEKWKKPFFKSMPTEYKLFWLYLLDDCDHCGIWHVDLEVAQIRLGTKLSLPKARGLYADRVVEFDNGTKWFIPDFISFQYGELCEKNKMTKAVLPTLTKYNLMGHLSPINGVKVKVKVKVKDREGGMEGEIRLPEKLLVDVGTFEKCAMNWGIDMPVFARMVNDFQERLDSEEKEHPNYSEYRKHFLNWGAQKFISYREKPKKMVY